MNREDKESAKSEGLTPGLAAAGSLVVGVLAAVGVAGDLLTRMVRNNPGQAALPLYGTIIAVAVLALTTALRSGAGWQRASGAVAVLLLTAALLCAVYIGVRSQDTREHPGISLMLDKSGQELAIHAKATGTSLRSDERMLLQILGVNSTSAHDLQRWCTTPQYGAQYGALSKDPLVVVSWVETGPNAKGEAATELKVPAAIGPWTHYCAYVALWDRDATSPDDNRSNWAVSAVLPTTTG